MRGVVVVVLRVVARDPGVISLGEIHRYVSPLHQLHGVQTVLGRHGVADARLDGDRQVRRRGSPPG